MATGEPIDGQGAVIDDDLVLTKATVEVPLLIDGAAITGSIHSDGAVFETPIIVVGVNISGRVHEQPVPQLVLPVLVGASEDG